MIGLNKWFWRDCIWLILGVITLLVKQNLDLTVFHNDGYRNINSAVVFTNRISVIDPVLWVSFSLFGVLFVSRRLAESIVLYPLIAGRVTMRKHLIRREMVNVYGWTGVYIGIGALASIWNGKITFETTYTYGYAWASLSLLVVILLLLEDGVHKLDGAFILWLLIAFVSTIEPITKYIPWMYGRAYLIWIDENPFIALGSLFVATFVATSIYIIRMKKADWI